MTSAIARARLLGALIVIIAFVGGVALGRYWPQRRPGGVVITITKGDRIPQEIEDLGLSDAQRVQIRQFIRAGAQRVDRVVQGFLGPMDAAVDSTDREIRTVLTAEQIQALDRARRERPLRQMKKQRVIDSNRLFR